MKIPYVAQRYNAKCCNTKMDFRPFWVEESSKTVLPFIVARDHWPIQYEFYIEHLHLIYRYGTLTTTRARRTLHDYNKQVVLQLSSHRHPQVKTHIKVTYNRSSRGPFAATWVNGKLQEKVDVRLESIPNNTLSWVISRTSVTESAESAIGSSSTRAAAPAAAPPRAA